MFFKDIIGQDDLKKQLVRTAQEGIVPHARMFCGEEGTGAFQLALAYARYINCTSKDGNDACGRCPSCLKYNELAHPDLHFVFPMTASKESKKEVCDDYIHEWREYLTGRIQQQLYVSLDAWLVRMGAENKQATIYTAESDRIIHKMNLKIYEANYRVLFVWMPDRMQTACANSLLKLIEEPPANTAILMVADSPDMVLETIVSRVQPVYVRPIPAETMVQALTDRFGIQDGDARQIAHLSNGNYLKAVELLSTDTDNAWFLEQFKTVMRNGWAKNIGAMKAFAEEMATLGREKQKRFLAFCQRQVRENFLSCLQEPSLNYMNREEADFARKFSPYVNERNIVDMMDELSLAERHIAQNVNARMVFFDLSMRMTVLVKR